MRKTWSLAQYPEHLLLHLEWRRTYYHFIRPHEALAVPVPGLRRFRPPSNIWSGPEVLKLPLMPVHS
jgi:transposase InsO family protein